MSQFFGKYRGRVENNIDPLMLGRVQVSAPAVLGDGSLSWALPCTPYAGSGVGLFAVPPVGANVWVEFEGGDPSYPIWTGCLWANGELPTEALTSDTRLLRTEQAQLTIDDLLGKVTLKNDLDASVTLALDVKTEAAMATHTVGALGVVSESAPGKVSVGVSGVSINNGAFTVM